MSSSPKDPNITPALKPPLGVTSNLINPPSKGYITIIVFVAYLGVSTPLVCLRMYVRRFINRKVWWDDCMFLSLSPSLSFLRPSFFSFFFFLVFFWGGQYGSTKISPMRLGSRSWGGRRGGGVGRITKGLVIRKSRLLVEKRERERERE